MCSRTVVISAVSKKGGVGRTQAVVEIARGIGRRRPDVLVVVVDLDPCAHATIALQSGTDDGNGENVVVGSDRTAIGLLTRGCTTRGKSTKETLAFFQRLAPNLLLLPGDPRVELLSAQVANSVLVQGRCDDNDAEGGPDFRDWCARLRCVFQDVETFAIGAEFSLVLGLIDNAAGFGVDPVTLLGAAASDALLVPVSLHGTDSTATLLQQVTRLRAGALSEIWAYRAAEHEMPVQSVFPPVGLLLANGCDAEVAAPGLCALAAKHHQNGQGPLCARGFGLELMEAVEALLSLRSAKDEPSAKRQRHDG